MTELRLPTSEEVVRKLKVGDEVHIFGTMITARDAAHKFLIEERPDFIRPYLENSLIYHCGPVVKKKNGTWSFVAAGPTTSIREEPYEGPVMKEYNVRGVIGKGGMGDKTLEALHDQGGVYLHAIGGLASLLAQSVKEVKEVFMLEEFGVPEAMWVIEVENFPAVVTMDSHRKSIHTEVKSKSTEQAQRLIHPVT
ncbi:MAG: FumA C-terminus/TtdB family hydratase beta subunit [Candidatus Marinimicrobia bacterium]|nr:FumA C-terminus/TtdB family hydratase beta subunit [Candidatus Neomarinimicrobiota bacterium]MCF7827838.1 FumA C-terminus/TtdB family hydratase beta subunit [Candidatus Neomarinimicrobiota bacterium]MCF7879407.1 FumA C-terminus/TtdB family hydratase beta subunit [Candidatus Neomarinimicrobiota bacterium]